MRERDGPNFVRGNAGPISKRTYVERSTYWVDWGVFGGRNVDAGARNGSSWTLCTLAEIFAKVRVAGSNPVFRSKHKHNTGTLSRVPVLFPRGGLPMDCPCSAHGLRIERKQRSSEDSETGTRGRPVQTAGSMRQRSSGSVHRRHLQRCLIRGRQRRNRVGRQRRCRILARW